jgi:hypothetical protein
MRKQPAVYILASSKNGKTKDNTALFFIDLLYLDPGLRRDDERGTGLPRRPRISMTKGKDFSLRIEMTE